MASAIGASLCREGGPIGGLHYCRGMAPMIRRAWMYFALLAIGLQLGGCFTDYGPVTTDSVPAAPYNVASHLRSGDQLKVIVFGEDALSGIYDVSPSGTITMPLIGSVTAAGRTPTDLARVLTRAYVTGKFLTEPKISISVVSYGPFYIFGEVVTPGRYPYASGLNVLTAVATAGGFTYRASRTSVLIRHPGDDVWQEYSLAAPILIQPGDLIRVPERYF